MNERVLEITHDSLAVKIWEKVSAQEKALLQARGFVATAHQTFRERDILLSAKDISYINPFVGKLTLTPDEHYFIKKSRRAQRNRKLIILSASVALLMFATLSVINIMQAKRNADAAKNQADAARIVAEKALTDFKEEEGRRKVLELDRLLLKADNYKKAGFLTEMRLVLDSVMRADSAAVKKRIRDLQLNLER